MQAARPVKAALHPRRRSLVRVLEWHTSDVELHETLAGAEEVWTKMTTMKPTLIG